MTELKVIEQQEVLGKDFKVYGDQEELILSIRLLELFGGIGSCTQAFKRLNIPHEVVDYVEIDKYAVKSYNAMNGTNFEPQDISKWDKDIEVDFIMHGSPCQDFSVAGQGKGASEGGETRSSLMYETVRIVSKLKPQYVLWENVKNVLSKKHKHNFDNYLAKMEEQGYTNYYQVLNAKDYNIPQNRERVFVLSILNDTGFEFPPKIERTRNLSDMLEEVVDEKFYISNEKAEKLISQLKNGKKGQVPTGVYQSSAALSSREHRCAGWKTQEIGTLCSRDYKDPKVVSMPCLTPDRLEKRQNGRRFKEDGEDMFTLTGQDRHGVLQIGNIVDTGNWDNPQRGRIYSPDGCSPSLNCVGGGGLEPKILEERTDEGLRTFKDNICGSQRTTNSCGDKRVLETYSQHERAIIDSNGQCCGHKTNQSDNFGYRKPLLETARTITANKHDSAVVKDYRIRKLTPNECWRLMGFSDEVFHLAEQVNSNSQLYKQAGNSIVVDVLVGIIEQIHIVKSRWLDEEYRCANMADPYQNVFSGIHIIGNLLNKYDDDYHKSLMAYNMGEYGAKKARENGITSTEYSKKIVELMLEYEQEINNEN